LVPGNGTFQPLSRAKRGVRLRASNQLAADRRLYRAKYIVQMTLDAFQRAPAPRGWPVCALRGNSSRCQRRGRPARAAEHVASPMTSSDR